MTESQVAFLYKAASSFQQAQSNKDLTILRSYYLMQCQHITKGYGLPEKQFSTKVRCPRCCIEWRKETKITVRPVKLSKRQRQRIQQKKVSKTNKEHVQKRRALIQSNEMEQICDFCQHSTITCVLKPKKSEKGVPKDMIEDKVKETTNNIKSKSKKTEPKDVKLEKKKITEVNVYSITKDVFSLDNKSNTISNVIKKEPKFIKNNKKKKDRFAGLCKKAVLASVKLKEDMEKKNKLKLFLKPSL